MKKEQKYSTINLHNFKDKIYLGFLSKEPLSEIGDDIDVSFFGGEPIWLQEPSQESLMCGECKMNLTFLGQFYCPLAPDRCYHRILYVLFCEKCLREYKCIRQQAPKSWQKPQNIKHEVKKLGTSYQIISDPFEKNEFNKLINRFKLQVQEEEVIDEVDSQDEEEVMMSQANSEVLEQFKKYDELNKEKNQNQGMKEEGQKQQEKDKVFEVYKRAIAELDFPCLLYTDVALPYNKRILNPQHFCKKCGSKLSLEFQITQRVLQMENNPNSRLLLMDWGSIMIYTCVASCNQNSEQCIVVQYQIDAIGDEDIKKLKKTKKNKKKKQQKKSKSKEKQQQQQKSQQQEIEKKNGQQGKQEEGDWD